MHSPMFCPSNISPRMVFIVVNFIYKLLNDVSMYVYMLQDAPVEEANVVEKILSHRIRPTTEAEQHLGETIEEFFVKYKN